ncbi:MAG: GtrA family protein [Caulobacteraceae bacterium]
MAATLLLMSVAFADGRPTVFYDSHSYDVMGRDLIETVRDWPESNQNKFHAHRQMGDWPVQTDRLVDPEVEGARSPFYGALLHASYLFTTIWGLAALQSFLAAWVVYLLWRTMAPKAPSWSYLAVIAAAAAGTSISFYTTFAMPDIFAGIGGAAVVLILAQGDRLRKLEIAGLWAVIAYSMTIHKSHWGTGLVVALAGGALLWIMGLATRSVVRRVLVVISAAVVAWAAGLAFNSVYENRTGHRLGHPPFITARLLADGPGSAYMRQACSRTVKGGAQPYVLCKFQANVHASTSVKVSGELISNLILWPDRKTLGVFNYASRAERVGLESEEMRFVLGTLKFDPAGQALASLSDWGQQLIAFQVDDPLRDPAAYLRGRYWRTTILPKLIPNFDACRPPGSCKPPFDRDLLTVWHGVVLVAGLLLLAWRLSLKDVRQAVRARGLKDGREPARVAATAILMIAVLVVNAAICGILSGPFARYQARLIWLLPLGAGLVACALPMGFERLLPLVIRAWATVGGLWERVRAQPVIGRFLPPLNGHFMRFCCAGGLGFVVDFTVLKTIVHLGANPIAARCLSFSVAVVVTWLVNRAWTFKGHITPGAQGLLREFAGYLAVQSIGFAANFSVFTAMVIGIPALDGRLLPPSVAGTIAGLVVNYLGAKHIVFRRRARAS